MLIDGLTMGEGFMQNIGKIAFVLIILIMLFA